MHSQFLYLPLFLGTLQQLLVECLSDLRKNKDGLDPLKYPSQILCLAQAIEFTENCEKAIKSATLPNFLNENKDQLDSYTSVDLDHDDTSNVLELKLKALILDTIHYGTENLLTLIKTSHFWTQNVSRVCHLQICFFNILLPFPNYIVSKKIVQKVLI